jgi:hypothetical protein
VNDLSLADYNVYFFGSSIKGSPNRILDDKNNRQIIGACIQPKTVQELQELGFKISPDQIKLLQEWRLLKTKDGMLQTSFPILNEEKSAELRELTRSLAPEIVQEINLDLKKYLNELEKEHFDAYLLFFSYVMDTLVWNFFDRDNLLPLRKLKNKNLLWSGVLWGNFSPKFFFLGTNQYDLGNTILNIVWNDNLLPKLKPFFLNQDKIFKMVKESNIPIIHEELDNPIYAVSIKLAQSLAYKVVNRLDLTDLVKQFGLRDEKQALVIIYHELMWSILEETENTGLLTKPRVITKPQNFREPDLKKLMFLLQKKVK